MIVVPVAVLEELADPVVVVESVVDAAEVVLADELAVAVRGGHLGVEEVAVTHPGELAGWRVLRAALFTCGESGRNWGMSLYKMFGIFLREQVY